MVGHLYSQSGEVKRHFYPVHRPVDRHRKIIRLGNTKLDISVLFFLTSGSFSISALSSCLLQKYPIVGKLGGARPALRGVFVWLG